jgi:hypothetical protein
LGNVVSEQCQVLSGVPQGSILGPLLFVIFVNDLPSVFSKCQVLTYADDTVIYYASKTVPEIEQILTNEFACLCQWLLDNNLFLNVKKTECLLFGTAPRLSQLPLPPSNDVMSSLRWTPLYKRREHHVFGLVKKSLTGTVHQFLTNYFTFNRDIHERSTRQSNQLHLPKVKTESAKKSFYYNGCIVYNSFIK